MQIETPFLDARADELAELVWRLSLARNVGGFLEIGQAANRGGLQYRASGYMVNPDVLKDQAVVLIASMKARELLLYGHGATPKIQPTVDYPWVTGFPGAYRTGLATGDYWVSFSGLPGPHDLLTSLVVMYGIEHKVGFNHAGFEYPDEATYLAAAEVWSQNQWPLIRADLPEDDEGYHQRYYAIAPDIVGYGPLMLEAQYFPRQPLPDGFRHEHVDLWTPDPVHMLEQITGWLKNSTIKHVLDIWGGDGPGPVGEVKVFDPKRNFWFGMMARAEEFAAWKPEGL